MITESHTIITCATTKAREIAKTQGRRGSRIPKLTDDKEAERQKDTSAIRDI